MDHVNALTSLHLIEEEEGFNPPFLPPLQQQQQQIKDIQQTPSTVSTLKVEGELQSQSYEFQFSKVP